MLTFEPYAIMLSKDDVEFKRLVDRAMATSSSTTRRSARNNASSQFRLTV
ncbi:hypothetical protein [Ralstonia pseudosolanacearum]